MTVKKDHARISKMMGMYHQTEEQMKQCVKGDNFNNKVEKTGVVSLCITKGKPLKSNLVTVTPKFSAEKSTRQMQTLQKHVF